MPSRHEATEPMDARRAKRVASRNRRNASTDSCSCAGWRAEAHLSVTKESLAHAEIDAEAASRRRPGMRASGLPMLSRP